MMLGSAYLKLIGRVGELSELAVGLLVCESGLVSCDVEHDRVGRESETRW